ncbi:MAG: M42 family metallopeptidase [Oscillospiraceae bacterium]|jgi:putative aminopeptidase FrvX
MELAELISRLSCLSGPSGFETAARETAAELLRPYVDELQTDAMGNLIGIKRCGKPYAQRLMLDAHLDEIGFLVTGIEDGFLRFANLGGVDPRMLPTREVQVLTEPPVFGVITTIPPEADSDSSADQALDPERLLIDVGMGQDCAKARIPLGTPVVFASGCEQLNKTMICGKALDDRACVAILIRTMEQLQAAVLDVDLYCLISTQEEVGLRGAVTGTYAIVPDYAIAVDVTHAHTPDAKREKTLAMGEGAAIGVGPNMNRNLTNALIDLAEKAGIAHQIEVIAGHSGTNGWVIQTSRAGVSTAVVSLPIKYMHTPVEVGSLCDAESIVELLTQFIMQWGGVIHG